MLNDDDALRHEGAASKQHPLWAALLAPALDASALAPLAAPAPSPTGAEQQKQID